MAYNTVITNLGIAWEVDDLYTNQELEEETLKNKVLEEIKKLLKKEKEVKKDG